MPSGYNRYFVTLKMDNKNYGYKNKEPLGRCIVETISSYGKISIAAQDLKPEIAYKIYVLFQDNPNTLGVCAGTLYVDAKGKGEFKIDLNPVNAFDSGRDICTMKGIALLVVNKKELTSPLVGFTDNSFDWKSNFIAYKPGKKAEPGDDNITKEAEPTGNISLPEVKHEEIVQPEPEPANPEQIEPLAVSDEEMLFTGVIVSQESLSKTDAKSDIERQWLTESVMEDDYDEPAIREYEGTSDDDEVRITSVKEVEYDFLERLESDTGVQEENEPCEICSQEIEYINTEEEISGVADIGAQGMQDREAIEEDNVSCEEVQPMEQVSMQVTEQTIEQTEMQTTEAAEPIEMQETEHTEPIEMQTTEQSTEQTTVSPEVREASMDNVPSAGHETVRPSESSSSAKAGTLPEYRALSNRDRRLDYIFKNNIEMTPFKVKSGDVKWVRISDREPINLSLDYQRLFNHHFITLAYRKYKHLILGISQTTPQSYYLGVPDVYGYEHKLIALSLGFTQFKCCDDVKPAVGEYGYWIMSVV